MNEELPIPATILLVDDHPVFRKGIQLLLEQDPDLRVVGEAGDGLEAIDRLRELSPDIVVMDISMPNLGGIEATRQILSEFPDTKVVALSVHSGKRFVRDMLQAGAAGYILKESVPEEMIQGIRTVLAGDVYLSRSISGIVVSEYKKLLSETEQPTQTPSEPILRTKLHPPPVSADIIPRIRLIELLEQGRHRPMTLISAPAGYGKSILASQWLETCGSPGAWVSLDENDNDLRLFFTYLLEAVQKAFPAASLESKNLLQAATFPPVEVRARYLLNDLEQVEEPFVLVLDDYHRISKGEVHELLTELLRHPTPMLHLALLTRRDPPLPTGPMRARGLLTEIGVEHLRFTLAETTAFLERFLHLTIDENTASILDERVEGWVTGLRLVALSLGQKEDQDRLLQGLKQGSLYVQEYLIQEVLENAPPDFARYLMETSILDRFCAPLCDVLHSLNREETGSEDDYGGQPFIDWLEQTHLFVIPLDEQHHWFRYHHLFQDLLQNQLKRHSSPGKILYLHSRASEWFEAEDLIDEALKHALAAEDIDRAVQLVERNRQSVFNADRWYILERWLSLLPDTVVKQRVELLLARAWVAYFHSNFEVIPLIMDQVEPLLGDDAEQQSLHGEAAFFRGCIHFFQNDCASSLKNLEDALERIPVSYHLRRGEAEVLFGVATQMVAGKEQATRRLDDLLNSYPPPHDLRKTRLLAAFVYVHVISGNLAEAETYNRLLHETSLIGHYEPPEAWSTYLQGLIHLYRYELDAAIQPLKRAVEQRFIFDMRAAVDSVVGLMFAYQALGRPDEAQATLLLLREYIDLNDPEYLALANSSEARLNIMQGRPESAICRLETSALHPDEVMLFWLEIPSVTHCRALIAEGSAASLREAEERLREYAKVNEADHNTCQLIGILALQAIAYEKQEKVEEALDVLEWALTLARPGGFIFPFLELGPPMADLLNRLIKKNVAVDYIEKILTAFRDDEQVVVRKELEAPAAPSPAVSPQPLVEPLTNRELDILELLEQRLQTKEIAEKMFISPETVKSHLKNIFQKLEVSNRRQAVERAKKLGIF